MSSISPGAGDGPLEHLSAGSAPLEDACEWLCFAALLAMVVLIGAEVVVRNVFGSSLQLTDEVCGYLLVAVTFLSMSVSEAHGAFHRVELVQARMRPRARLVLQAVFDVAALVASAVVTWQLGRMAFNAWRAADVAPTPLQTPLWIPQSVMVLGMAVLCIALVRSIRVKLRGLARGGRQ